MADLFSSSVVLEQDFDGEVVNDRDLPGHNCCFDIYFPGNTGSPPPVVLLVIGFPDFGRKQESGKGLKDLPPYISWGKLLASDGMAAVIASCADPEQDLPALLDHLTEEQDKQGLDMDRLALWACSGNGPVALHLLANYPAFRAGVFFYSFLADLGEQNVVATTAEQFGFRNPATNRGLLIESKPLLVVRAGKDEFAGLNETMDHYLEALANRNQDIEFIDYPEGVHGFDLVDSSPESRQIVRRSLDYLNEQLSNSHT